LFKILPFREANKAFYVCKQGACKSQLYEYKINFSKKGSRKQKRYTDNGEIKLLVQEIHDHWEESKLELGTRDREMAAMQKN
jgi:hypothetical protein